MVPPMRLPWDLEEDILSRLPVQSLALFRSVCRRWNALLDEKWFITNHFAQAPPQFIFLTSFNIYSIEIIGLDGVDPTINLRKVGSLGVPNWEVNLRYTTISTCNGFLFCVFWYPIKAAAIWNPWLRQLKWIEYEDKKFHIRGIGYDNTKPEKVYKILGFFMFYCKVQRNHHQRVAIYDCACHAFKYIDIFDMSISIIPDIKLSLNGNLYWVSRIRNTSDYFIQSFDFSREILIPFCLLPCRKNKFFDVFVLAVFKGDGFSLLKQCSVTRNIEIWVTKNKIDISNNNEEEVVWVKLLTLSSSNLPRLRNQCFHISYFIYDKTTLIMCCSDEEAKAASIYIVRADLFKKFETESGIFDCCHCVYAPNFIPVL